MNVMHRKTEKFITQLRCATHGLRRNMAKYPNISYSAGLN